MTTLRVVETFSSIQGESTFTGQLCWFVRLEGCNLRCSYCDTEYAYEGGSDRSIDELVEECCAAPGSLAEITGGEPLMQEGFAGLARRLRDDSGKTVLVETNGSHDISVVPEGIVAVIDVKTPGSGEGDSFDMANLERLRPCDELKFVICDRSDYEWAREFVIEHGLNQRNVVHFSPAADRIVIAELAEWITEDGLNVRLSLQLHKVLGVK